MAHRIFWSEWHLQAKITHQMKPFQQAIMHIIEYHTHLRLLRSKRLSQERILAIPLFALALACSFLALGASFRRPVRMQRTTSRLAVALEA
jgi:hypothetical protein